MNYVFLDIETTGLDYKKDELIFIQCKKYDRNFKELEELKLYIKPKNKISEYVEKITKITNKELENGCYLKEALEKLKQFLRNCYVICFNGKFDFPFLLTAMYHTKVDMNFWYLDLSILLREKLHYKNMKQLFERYNINFHSGFNKYIELTKRYMEDNNVPDLKELVRERPRNWNAIFRGINYPEYLGDSGQYTFYIADLTTDKYPSYLAYLKEIRGEDFTLEELQELKRNHNVKILVHILKIDEKIIKVTSDYYIVSYGPEIDPTKKWGRDYIEELSKAADFITTRNDTVEITCYDTIKELEEKTQLIDKKIMDIVKSKIVREKTKWSRW